MSLDYLHDQFGNDVPRENDVKESSKYDDNRHYLIITLNNLMFEFSAKFSSLWIEIITEQKSIFSYYFGAYNKSLHFQLRR